MNISLLAVCGKNPYNKWDRFGDVMVYSEITYIIHYFKKQNK